MRLAPARTFAVVRLTVRAPRRTRSSTRPAADDVSRRTARLERRTPARRGGARSRPAAGVVVVAAPLPTTTLPRLDGCASQTDEDTPAPASRPGEGPPPGFKPQSEFAGARPTGAVG